MIGDPFDHRFFVDRNFLNADRAFFFLFSSKCILVRLVLLYSVCMCAFCVVFCIVTIDRRYKDVIEKSVKPTKT